MSGDAVAESDSMRTALAGRVVLTRGRGSFRSLGWLAPIAPNPWPDAANPAMRCPHHLTAVSRVAHAASSFASGASGGR